MEDRFKAAVEAASTPNYIGTKSEVIDYYKDTHGDKWRRAIAHDLHGSIKNKKGENMSVANIARRFEGGRELKAAKTKDVKGQFKQLGEKLPPVSRSPKGGEVTLHIKGNQKTGKGGTRERNITVKMRGDEAYTWVNNPTWETMWDYGDYGYAFDEDGEYALTDVSIT